MEVCNKLQDDPRDSRSAVANRRQKAVPSPPEGSFVTWPFAKMQTPTTARPLAWLRALAIQVSSKVFSSSVLRSKTIRFWSPSSKPSSFSGAPSGTEFFGPDGVAKGRMGSHHAEKRIFWIVAWPRKCMHRQQSCVGRVVPSCHKNC